MGHADNMVMSAHAPTEHATDVEKDASYENLFNVCRQFKSGIGIDGNAQYGKEKVSTALGRWHFSAHETTANGRTLLDFWEMREFVLASSESRGKVLLLSN
ncbi:hypothetical protein AB6A40_002536 [Gnathostoma spinigerum]|uniref:Uncharacterized protein n=1 Tax=Gnathostoma spinigerum TaxID=75299 RepID=A0ABD6EGL8_9BILA